MATPDGETLSRLRTDRGISQAVVARRAGVSTGHISRVETGVRPVSPAVLTGYEVALGLRLRDLVLLPAGDTLGANTPLRQEADQMRRRAFTAAIAAIAAGGPLGEPIQRAVAALGGADTPARVGLADVVQVEKAEQMFTSWDLRFGGGLAREMAGAQLRWATGLLEAQMSDLVKNRLHTAVGSLAERAAWSSFDAGRHDSARTLFKLALYAATEADDADLRAHVLSDIATQQLYLGHPGDCLTVIRMAEGDDRISAGVKFVLHGVKARAYGALGDAGNCTIQIGKAESAYAGVRPEKTPGWMTGFLCDAHVHSVTGQAAYNLAWARGQFSDDAHTRLSTAITGLGDGRARAVALCATRLATLHLHAGNLPEGRRAARTALAVTPGLRSARIDRDLGTVHTAADLHPDDADLREISSQITDALATVG